jgi:hypothetical protein
VRLQLKDNNTHGLWVLNGTHRLKGDEQMELKSFFQLFNEECAKTGKQPRVKVSKEWYEKQLQSTFVLRNNNESVPNLIGIPVEFDDNVDTFEFVYKN